MTTLIKYADPMILVAAMFVLFGFLRPGEECGGHCRTCTGNGAGCSTKGSAHHG